VIVVDTNVVAGLFLPAAWSARSEELLATDSDWAAPALWRSELRNTLATSMRTNRLDLDAALRIMETAEALLSGREFSVDSGSVLRLAAESRCTAYDCEFVVLAQHLGVRLVTLDRELLEKFPAVSRDLNEVA
jgi:predicted nucleic acid-binding protein